MADTDETKKLLDNGDGSVQQSKSVEEEEELGACGGNICCNPRRRLHRYLVLIPMCLLSFEKQNLGKDLGLHLECKNVLLYHTAGRMLAEWSEPRATPRGCSQPVARPLATTCSSSRHASCPRTRPLRFFMKILGSYFCYDNPAAMQDVMVHDLNIDKSTFMSFYAWYSWPNVILSLIGGFLLDRVFGVRLGTIIFALFVCGGQVIFAMGAYIDAIWLMDAGRFVFGIGGESLAVAQNTYAVSWFKGRELNMVFGLQLSFARIGSTVNMNVMLPLYTALGEMFNVSGYKNLGVALGFGAFTCIFSLCCGILLAFLDKRAARILKKDVGKTGEVIQLRDIKDFGLSLWLICIICVAYYVTVFPFIGLGLVFFESKFDMQPSDARIINSLVFIISAVASPACGFLVDRTGRNVFWCGFATLLTTVSHALFAFTFLNPYVAMAILGISYSLLASSLWPMVSYVVPQHQLGTAYGIMQSVQNLGLAVISILCGIIVDAKGYLILEVFFLILLFVAIISIVVLYIWNETKGGELNLSAKEHQARRDAEEEKEKSEK